MEFFHFPRYPRATFGSVWSFGVLVDHGTAVHVHKSWIHCLLFGGIEENMGAYTRVP
jgi:hypothetical protein